jgi:hypothetical protein
MYCFYLQGRKLSSEGNCRYQADGKLFQTADSGKALRQRLRISTMGVQRAQNIHYDSSKGSEYPLWEFKVRQEML